MEFRRITNLPPYVFAIINGLKIEARRAGADVIDLGFGNPDIPSPQIAVDKLVEAAQNPKNHRYSRQRVKAPDCPGPPPDRVHTQRCCRWREDRGAYVLRPVSRQGGGGATRGGGFSRGLGGVRPQET